MDSKLQERLRDISQRLKNEYHAEKVILFGSYAREENTKDSDVDILVIAPTKEQFFQRMATVRRLVRDLRYGLPLSPIVMTKEEVDERKEKGDHFVLEIVRNGVSL
ncbi:MAG: hypothetical protein A2W23_01515 [Planctomycetes bacterium RBG_16_43_13]|nr:MAG: hypothetical protein A2W23_01515 [Planctomycetes bacterium RBG_16_43_13]